MDSTSSDRSDRSDRSRSRDRTPSVPAGSDRYEALLDVLEQQADRAARADRPRRGGGGRRLQLVVLLCLLGITAWLWILPPAWLIPPPTPLQPVEQEEAALRFTMYLQAQRIRAYQLREGALPETLEEAGQEMPGMTYVVLGPDRYELTGSSARLRLTYVSTEPLREWVGPGADLLDASRAP